MIITLERDQFFPGDIIRTRVELSASGDPLHLRHISNLLLMLLSHATDCAEFTWIGLQVHFLP